jgi:DNA-nicking Smr family endonuclease
VAARLRAASSRPGPAPGPDTAASARSPTFAIEQAGETWSARADGVDRRLLRKLAAGKVTIEGRIDLHGESRLEALEALERFLAAAEAQGRRALLVIHGRGLHSGVDGPTLRDAVRELLTTGAASTRVLGCSSAPPAQGGPGATLVWLRRRLPSRDG